jgi:hypothetical protein
MRGWGEVPRREVGKPAQRSSSPTRVLFNLIMQIRLFLETIGRNLSLFERTTCTLALPAINSEKIGNKKFNQGKDIGVNEFLVLIILSSTV